MSHRTKTTNPRRWVIFLISFLKWTQVQDNLIDLSWQNYVTILNYLARWVIEEQF